jgi:hypothetical protein
MKAHHRWLLLWSSILTGGTGLIYWWMKHMMDPVSEWAVINHPLQPWVLKTHILVSPILVFSLGLIASDHILAQLKTSNRSGQGSGLLAVFLLAPMGFSGYLIQAVTHPDWLSVLAWTHLATGCLYLAGLVFHRASVRSRTVPRRSRVESPVPVSGETPIGKEPSAAGEA